MFICVNLFCGFCYVKIYKKLIMKNRLEKRVILNYEIVSKCNFYWWWKKIILFVDIGG